MRSVYRNSLAAFCAIAALAQSVVAQRIAIRNVTVVEGGDGGARDAR
jgi:hypothetical protein